MKPSTAILKAIKRRGISQKNLASALGYSSQSSISSLLRDNISIGKMIRVADALNMELVLRPKKIDVLPADEFILTSDDAPGDDPNGETITGPDGRALTAIEWSRELGGSPSLVSMRLKIGWTPDRAVSEPLKKKYKKRAKKSNA
ncbi:MAG: helix-turn-helix domain-containing protein [Oscillospiraceae bacterium]